jgi:hypothetical protein
MVLLKNLLPVVAPRHHARPGKGEIPDFSLQPFPRIRVNPVNPRLKIFALLLCVPLCGHRVSAVKSRDLIFYQCSITSETVLLPAPFDAVAGKSAKPHGGLQHKRDNGPVTPVP